MATIPRTCTCADAETCRKAREGEAAYLGVPQDPAREPPPERDDEPTHDLDWLDPLDEAEFEALRLAWAFMQ